MESDSGRYIEWFNLIDIDSVKILTDSTSVRRQVLHLYSNIKPTMNDEYENE